MPAAMVHSRKPRIPSDPVAAFGDDDVYGYTQAPPLTQDRPHGAANIVATSPVDNAWTGNDQEMASGSDATRGVRDSNAAGGDYSREQGVGRAPGWRWPWEIHSLAFNFQSLDRWALERTDAIDLPGGSGLNPFEGVPEQPYSPITAMDQYTTYYENNPDQWYAFSPPPITVNQEGSPAFAEQAVLY
jgi:hypothetical protein